ncbi:hypothetical protein [Actomonas aquatica]|uniref:Uncharacterized protein n=1 Tax=Actomonas aquatica TaxID=2866162 RepID=A0ABZ1C233_9BACT|nr:hypothetical protein [Opitutus sp. WL0086]WRQ85534.1 hypothetical protein K1X11_012045 [Opitutus sp. WL0086]
MPYFLISRVEVGAGFALVDGRIGDSALKTGHRFTQMFDRVDAWRVKEDGKHCSFTLVGIEAYRHTFEELDAGLTARLRIEGEELDQLNDAEVIS